MGNRRVFHRFPSKILKTHIDFNITVKPVGERGAKPYNRLNLVKKWGLYVI